MQPAEGRYTKNDRVKIKKWYKLANVMKSKRHKTNGSKQGMSDTIHIKIQAHI